MRGAFDFDPDEVPTVQSLLKELPANLCSRLVQAGWDPAARLSPAQATGLNTLLRADPRPPTALATSAPVEASQVAALEREILAVWNRCGLWTWQGSLKVGLRILARRAMRHATLATASHGRLSVLARPYCPLLQVKDLHAGRLPRRPRQPAGAHRQARCAASLWCRLQPTARAACLEAFSSTRRWLPWLLRMPPHLTRSLRYPPSHVAPRAGWPAVASLRGRTLFRVFGNQDFLDLYEKARPGGRGAVLFIEEGVSESTAWGGLVRWGKGGVGKWWSGGPLYRGWRP